MTTENHQNTEKEEKIENESKSSLFLEILKTILTVAFIFVVVRYFVIQPFLVVGSSMEPNFHDGEYLFVNELVYSLSKPGRGDVIVFKHPEPACNAHISKGFLNRIFIQGPCKNYIKRVIGLPGETITVFGGKVTIANSQNPGGFELDEEYIPANIKLFGNQIVTLDNNEYYVLGDNRQPNGSSDSREWGSLPSNYITGKAWLSVIPNFGFIPKPKY